MIISPFFKNTLCLKFRIISYISINIWEMKNEKSRNNGHNVYTRLRKKTNNRMSNTDPTKNRGELRFSQRICMRFLSLIRHPSCYLYVVGENNIRKKEKIHCHLRYGSFSHSDRDDDRIILKLFWNSLHRVP